MNDFLARQVSVLRYAVSDYRNGNLSLNALVGRIEGISAAVCLAEWTRAMDTVILTLEQINASTLESKRPLSQGERELIEQTMEKIEMFLQGFSSNRP